MQCPRPGFHAFRQRGRPLTRRTEDPGAGASPVAIKTSAGNRTTVARIDLANAPGFAIRTATAMGAFLVRRRIYSNSGISNRPVAQQFVRERRSSPRQAACRFQTRYARKRNQLAGRWSLIGLPHREPHHDVVNAGNFAGSCLLLWQYPKECGCHVLRDRLKTGWRFEAVHDSSF